MFLLLLSHVTLHWQTDQTRLHLLANSYYQSIIIKSQSMFAPFPLLCVSPISTDFTNSYVPHDIAVAGTLMLILGNTPLVNANAPSVR